LVLLFSVFAALAVLAVRLAEMMPAIKSPLNLGFCWPQAGVGMAVGAAVVGQFGQRFRRLILSLIRLHGHGADADGDGLSPPNSGLPWG
jgi:hypothetical protein